MTRRGGLFRSTDRAQTWEPLSDRYLFTESPVDGPGAIVLSPTYAQDQTLFVSHDGLQRSTDGGQSWTRQMPQGAGSMALSPEFASDGTAFGWFSSSGVLRSSDGGQTWQPASAGLPLSGYGWGRAAHLARLCPGSDPVLHLDPERLGPACPVLPLHQRGGEPGSIWLVSHPRGPRP